MQLGTPWGGTAGLSSLADYNFRCFAVLVQTHMKDKQIAS